MVPVQLHSVSRELGSYRGYVLRMGESRPLGQTPQLGASGKLWAFASLGFLTCEIEIWYSLEGENKVV